MKIFRIFGKSVREAFKSVFRNFSLSVASISCTTITLIIVAIALVATYNVNSITKKIEDVLTIVVFVDKNATDDEIKQLIEEEIEPIKKNIEELKLEFYLNHEYDHKNCL